MKLYDKLLVTGGLTAGAIGIYEAAFDDNMYRRALLAGLAALSGAVLGFEFRKYQEAAPPTDGIQPVNPPEAGGLGPQ